MNLITLLAAEGRAPRLIVLENVRGLLSSNDGKDFAAIGDALAKAGYRFGAVVIDAALFVPQSRPRLFIIAVHATVPVPAQLVAEHCDRLWHPKALLRAHERLSSTARQARLWWRLPPQPIRNASVADLIEDEPKGVAWHTPEKTRRLLAMMDETNRAKVEAAKRAGRRVVGVIYKRMRTDGDGAKVQRAEVRFDGLAGRLRTPAGGSSRQIVIIVEGETMRSRLLSPREGARLMGLPEEYELPSSYTEAYDGDGVVVPVVRFIAAHILEPILTHADARRNPAALPLELADV
jgi:DNA (cytosine-5)-methyltransferase 1